jgi:signal transduction histidine kinase
MRSEFIDDESIRAKMLQDLDLMDSMLYKNLQRLRENRLATEYRLIDLNSIIQTVVHHFSDSGHRVNYDGAGRQMIVGSSVDLQRIFNNLIENAVKYAGAASVVLTEPSADVVQIDVMDEGPGISPRDKQRLIEPYRRGAAAAQGGFGLGLSIAHSLVEQANGQLRLIDREPRGLIVRITLPRGQVDRS